VGQSFEIYFRVNFIQRIITIFFNLLIFNMHYLYKICKYFASYLIRILNQINYIILEIKFEDQYINFSNHQYSNLCLNFIMASKVLIKIRVAYRLKGFHLYIQRFQINFKIFPLLLNLKIITKFVPKVRYLLAINVVIL
jgi:hypothetical protein